MFKEKVALVIAAGAEYVSPVITQDIARWSVGIVEHCLTDLIYNAARNVATNRYEKDLLKVLRIIETAGQTGITAKNLGRKTQSLDQRLRNSILSDLQESDRIMACVVKFSTQKTKIYKSSIYHDKGVLESSQ